MIQKELRGSKMSRIEITLIDVGWGDSILIESIDTNNNSHFALIDSNDTTKYKSSYIFIKRYFEKKGINITDEKPIFDFICLTHAHTDHGQGLKAIMQDFGTKRFWYPKSENWGSLAYLIEFSNRSSNVLHHQSIDDTKILPNIGDISLNVLWPPYQYINTKGENNNSIVLALTLNNSTFLLTGDAEEEVWENISTLIPPNTKFIKVPHHGSKNGTFDKNGDSQWLLHTPQDAILGISSHVRPFSHPDPEVISLFDSDNRLYYRTDEHYHITISSDGNSHKVKYSHV